MFEHNFDEEPITSFGVSVGASQPLTTYERIALFVTRMNNQTARDAMSHDEQMATGLELVKNVASYSAPHVALVKILTEIAADGKHPRDVMRVIRQVPRAAVEVHIGADETTRAKYEGVRKTLSDSALESIGAFKDPRLSMDLATTLSKRMPEHMQAAYTGVYEGLARTVDTLGPEKYRFLGRLVLETKPIETLQKEAVILLSDTLSAEPDLILRHDVLEGLTKSSPPLRDIGKRQVRELLNQDFATTDDLYRHEIARYLAVIHNAEPDQKFSTIYDLMLESTNNLTLHDQQNMPFRVAALTTIAKADDKDCGRDPHVIAGLDFSLKTRREGGASPGILADALELLDYSKSWRDVLGGAKRADESEATIDACESHLRSMIITDLKHVPGLMKPDENLEVLQRLAPHMDRAGSQERADYLSLVDRTTADGSVASRMGNDVLDLGIELACDKGSDDSLRVKGKAIIADTMTAPGTVAAFVVSDLKSIGRQHPELAPSMAHEIHQFDPLPTAVRRVSRPLASLLAIVGIPLNVDTTSIAARLEVPLDTLRKAAGDRNDAASGATPSGDAA